MTFKKSEGYMTKTTMGYIPHCVYRGLTCPVKLSVRKDGKSGNVLDTDENGIPKPEILGNELLAFALPGGLEFFVPLNEWIGKTVQPTSRTIN